MIAARAPFRVTLGGGGTDLPSFYEQHGGFILAMGIDKYMYVTFNRPLVERRVVLRYTKNESVEHSRELKHELAREALLLNGLEHSVEISSLADIPASTGLGSSSCYLVALLTAIHCHKKDYISLHEIAEEACRIELDILKKGIGKQDQFMASFGGLTALTISKSGQVSVENLELEPWVAAELISNTHIYYLQRQRDSLEVLADQNLAMKRQGQDRRRVEENLLQIKAIGLDIKKALLEQNFDEFGRLLDRHWQCKKQLSGKITYPEAEDVYAKAKKDFGVLGGKIIGAGGGGFMMLYCPRQKKELTAFMENQGYFRLPYTLDLEGAKLI